MGGATYETFVITHLWAGSPPESVTGWNPVPQYAIEPVRFWGRASALYALSTLAILIVAWLMPRARRKWALVAGLCALVIILSTGLFFVPILRETIFTRGAGLSPEQISTKVHQWVNWNWARMVLVFVGWLAGIWALSISKVSNGTQRAI
jgi:Na+/melibiose symporter-like transporter